MVQNLPKSPHVDLWQALQELEPARVDCKQRTLFRRGETCRGVYLVEKGQVRLSLAADTGTTQPFEIVGAGSVLGLAETMSGGEHKLTAEVCEEARISYLDRQHLLARLTLDHQLCLKIVYLLSENLHDLYDCFRCMGPSNGRPSKRPSRTIH